MANPASAETPPRCALLGQMTVSTWLEMLGGLSRAKGHDWAPVIDRLAGMSETYTNLGCDVNALAMATDCLIEKSGTAEPRTLARNCMVDAGIAGGE